MRQGVVNYSACDYVDITEEALEIILLDILKKSEKVVH